jgi:hypothetical protein
MILDNPGQPDMLDEDGNETLKGHDVGSTGPSDSSDGGSDTVGLGREDDTSDRNGTGERGSVGTDVDVQDCSDIRVDRVVGARQAGLGHGLDQAEEAQLGITDEQIAALGEGEEDELDEDDDIDDEDDDLDDDEDEDEKQP